MSLDSIIYVIAATALAVAVFRVARARALHAAEARSRHVIERARLAATTRAGGG